MQRAMPQLLLVAALALIASQIGFTLPARFGGMNPEMARPAEPDSTVQASEKSDDRPVFDADIYDEETTIYATVHPMRVDRRLLLPTRAPSEDLFG